jgi:hypothetical protein
MTAYALPPIEAAAFRLGDDVLILESGEVGMVTGTNVLLTGRRVYHLQLSTGEYVSCLASEVSAVPE